MNSIWKLTAPSDTAIFKLNLAASEIKTSAEMTSYILTNQA